MATKSPTAKPRMALRRGFGEYGATGSEAGTTTLKSPVAVALRIARAWALWASRR